MNTSFTKIKSYIKISFIIYLLIIKFHFMDFNLQVIDNVFFIGLFALLSIIFSIESMFYQLKAKIFKLNISIVLSVLFIILGLSTTFINVRKLPLVPISYNIILFFLMMYIDSSRVDKEFIDKEMTTIFKILSFSISTTAIISLSIVFIESIFNLNLFNYSSFFQETRFVGVIGFNQNPITVASTALIGIATSSILYSRTKKQYYIIFSIFNLIALLLTDSRGALLGLLGMTLIVSFYYFIKSKNKKNIIISYLAIVLLLISFSYYNSTKSPIRSLQATSSEAIVETEGFNENPNLKYAFQETSLLMKLSNGRFYIYREAFILGMKSPIIGNGFNTFVNNSKKEFGDKSYAASFTSEDPHNLVFSVFYYTGILGLIIVGLFFTEIFKNSFKLLKKTELEDYIMVGIVFGFFVISMFDYNMFIRVNFYPGMFWTFVGYILFRSKIQLNVE